MFAPLPDWTPRPIPKGVALEGVTFVWCNENGAMRVFEDAIEVPRLVSVEFNGDTPIDSKAIIRHYLPDGSCMARMLEPPYTFLYEKGYADA